MFVVTEREGAAPANDDSDQPDNITEIIKEVVHKRFTRAHDGGATGLTDIKECKMEHDHKT